MTMNVNKVWVDNEYVHILTDGGQELRERIGFLLSMNKHRRRLNAQFLLLDDFLSRIAFCAYASIPHRWGIALLLLSH